MRVKKQKRHRKVVRFYTACFGFREPFKVLCDGTFIHHLLHHHLTPAADQLSRLLGSRALLFSSRCINAELKSLGESHLESFRAAYQLVIARCDHEKRVSAAKCIEGIIAEGNPEHFFVATQDADLRKEIRERPGVPIIYGVKNSLFLDQPSAREREYVKSSEEKRLHMSGLELQMLHKRELKDKLPLQVAVDSPGEHDILADEVGTMQAVTNIATARRRLDMAEKSKFKRNKAKGPNPLSCKKKKTNEISSGTNRDGSIGDVIKRKRNRKRKRSQKNGNHGDSDT